MDRCTLNKRCLVCQRPIDDRASHCPSCWKLGRKPNNWKGGRYKTPKGYMVVHGPGHPRANQVGQVSEHILVAEKLLGRPIGVDEAIHHLNGIRDDNRPENLRVMSSLEHKKLHGTLFGFGQRRRGTVPNERKSS